MEQAVEAYRSATERNDIGALVDVLAPNVELVSPLSGRFVFRGREDLRVLAAAVYSTLADLRWTESFESGSLRVVVGTARIGPFRLGDVTLIELDDEGLIRAIRPYLRPWLATTFFALVLGPKLALRPGVLWRAARSR